MSQSAIGGLILTLRRSLRARLLRHAAQQITAASTKQTFCSHYVGVLTSLRRTRLTLSHLRRRPEKRLQVGTPVAFNALRLTPVLMSFVTRCPSLRIRLDLGSHFVSPVSRNFSIAIHVTRVPLAAGLVIRALTPYPIIFYTTPDCFRRRNAPARPSRLGRRTYLSCNRLSRSGT